MWKTSDAEELYLLDSWGEDYFQVNRKGYVTVHPKQEKHGIELVDIIESLKAKKLDFPVLLRFPQILQSRLRSINEAFANAINDNQFNGCYQGVFPFKVNQQKDVVTALMDYGKPHKLGLEVGSKSELLTALSFTMSDDALLVCNGFKDESYLRLAMASDEMVNIVIVIDEIGEVNRIIKMAKVMRIKPTLGLRIKLSIRGSGKWAATAGEHAKFGLTTPEIIHTIDTLREAGMLDSLKMLHFHVGSQITDIKRVQDAIKEGARVYSKLRRMKIKLQYLNIGGGLGVDYDGSRTPSDASMNYTLQEYANTVVYNVKDVCEREDVQHPTIVSESGRALVSFHSLLLFDVLGKIPEHYSPKDIEVTGDDSHIVQELYSCWMDIKSKNYLEYYHDAVHYKDELGILFNLGHLSLEQKAKGETLFWDICHKVIRFSRSEEEPPEEIEQLFKHIARKYICNFSLFQSAPDIWGIRQLFPIFPIQRLNEEPQCHAHIADVTCDSMGIISKYVDIKDVKDTLEIHNIKEDEEYVLAMALIGAYQDTLGDVHNLFGAVNEAHIIIGKADDWHIKRTIKGDDVRSVVSYMRYSPDSIIKSIELKLEGLVKDRVLTKKSANRIEDQFKSTLDEYTYLE